MASSEAPNASAINDASGRERSCPKRHQRCVSNGEAREPRHRSSASDPTPREIEDHVLTGHARFQSRCAACVRGARSSRENIVVMRTGKMRTVLKSRVCRGCRNNDVEVEQRGDSLVLVMHVGVTKSSSARVVSSNGVDVLGCEQVVVDDKMVSFFFGRRGRYR